MVQRCKIFEEVSGPKSSVGQITSVSRMRVRGDRCEGVTVTGSIEYRGKLLGKIYLEIIHQRESSRGNRGKFQVWMSPYLKEPEIPSAPSLAFTSKPPFWGLCPSIPHPSFTLNMGKPFVLQTQGFRIIFSSFLTHGIHIYPMAIHTDNVTASFNFNSVLGIMLRTFVICMLSSPSTLPNPSF